jgi:hypothetical protein
VEDLIRQQVDALLIRIADPDPVPVPLENGAVMTKGAGILAH